MEATTRILIAFLLNLGFSVFELAGGVATGSVAIASDALHAFGDAVSTGVAYFLERKSEKKSNRRYSILGAIITTAILISGALTVLHSSIERIWEPVEVDYEGMMWLAIVGIVFSAVAAFVTRDGHGHHDHCEHGGHTAENFNQKVVSLHMLQDVFSWTIVLAGSLVMRFFDFAAMDACLSIGVAVFILVNSVRNLNEILKGVEVK